MMPAYGLTALLCNLSQLHACTPVQSRPLPLQVVAFSVGFSILLWVQAQSTSQTPTTFHRPIMAPPLGLAAGDLQLQTG